MVTDDTCGSAACKQFKKLLDCDQSNVVLVHIMFSCILLGALSYLSTCTRDPTSIWDWSNIILIVTGIEVVIGNCLPVYLASLWRYGTSKITGSRPWPFWVTWHHRSHNHSTWVHFLWVVHCDHASIWHRYGRLFQEQRSVIGRLVLNITLISYTPLHYVRNVVWEEYKRSLIISNLYKFLSNLYKFLCPKLVP